MSSPGSCGPRWAAFAFNASPRRGPWAFGFDPSGWSGFWGGAGGPGGPGGRRVFGQGDLKYVILQLLEEKPRHGYDIIKELEQRFGGAYSPSPGTVYPTLTLLEDLGYARAGVEESGKKIYEITDEGRAHLAEHRSTVDDIFERIAQFTGQLFGGGMSELHQAFRSLGRVTYMTARAGGKPEQLTRIQQILERAAKEIEELK